MASIFKRKNAKTWTASVFLTVDGKRKTKQKNGFATKAEANEWVTKVEYEKSLGKLGNSNSLFIDEMKKWYQIFKEPKISRETKLWYQNAIRIANEQWKNKKVNEVTAAHFQTLINDYSQEHVQSSANRIKTIITAFVRYAVDEEIINRDFTKNVYVAAKKAGKKPIDKFLEDDELKKLMKRAKESNDLSAHMIITQLMTGMRYAETAGLTPTDVDLENKTISINKNWDLVTQSFKPTKTPSSNRTISISDELVDLFKVWGFGKQFVFEGRNGFPLTTNGINKSLREFLIADDSKIITSHGLRHTHASYLLAHDVSVQYVSERLGHANVNITLEIYAHLFKSKRELEDKKAQDLINKL
ncbi:site-specific integrase [Convivina praedatoris]|uniref:Tyrosine recombinase XerC n=1 Tax=Convivina praedatoris TaxID=2880963 RepID=A0ABN8HEF6_9LACO|nr:site-specific integrase [Convivina sp. LMG 32447]CAH1855838.1 Tyrosine recombinase XerC [Convivina sp. LMG 32447]